MSIFQGSGENSPTSSPTRAERVVMNGEVTEIIPNTLTERRRNAMTLSNHENQLLGTEGEHKSISQAIYVPGDNLSDDQWTITIIPPSPNPEASMSEKQATPKKQQQIPQWEGDEIAQCLDACHLG